MPGLNKINAHFNSTIYALCYLYKVYRHNRNQLLSLAKLRELQLKKLKVLLQHVYHKVVYYKRIFDQAGIRPGDINSLEDLVKIPITDRKVMQGLSREEIIAGNTDMNSCAHLRTSGSAGMPLDIFIDRQDSMIRRSLFMRMYYTNGRKFNHKVAIITTPQHFLSRKWFHPVLYGLGILREEFISLFESENNILKMVSRYQPDIILSYCSIAKLLAYKVEKNNIKGISPLLMFLTGESLTIMDRKYISSVFKTEVFDFYSTNECGLIAWECKEHSCYHINSDNVIIESVKEDGAYAKPGEEGEIVLTNLNSYSMPFIRYRIGDMGVLSDEKCPCGESLPLIKMLKGRVNDYVILPNGKRLPAFLLTCEIEKIVGIIKYQVVQKTTKSIIINILKDDMVIEQTLFELKRNVKRLLGEDVEVEIESLDNSFIENKSNKFRTVISQLDS